MLNTLKGTVIFEGEPTVEEIRWWADWDGMQDHLAIRHTCPCCGGGRTRWLRQEWNICFNCELVFTFADLATYIDVDRITEYDKVLMAGEHYNHEAQEWEEIARRFDQ